MSLLRLENVSKNFGGLKALSGISFEVNEGEILGIIGPNGAGKTTLFNTVTGFYKPDSGAIWFEDRDLRDLKPHQICQKGLARTFQLVRPFLQLTVLENVAVAALNRCKTLRAADDHARRTLESVGLIEKADVPAAGLTLGHRKRLELARALATQPRLLLLDEVMAGLNPTETDELILLLRNISHSGITVLMIEHVMRGVMALSSRIVVLNYGQKIGEGNPHDVVKNPQVIEAYLGEELKDGEPASA